MNRWYICFPHFIAFSNNICIVNISSAVTDHFLNPIWCENISYSVLGKAFGKEYMTTPFIHRVAERSLYSYKQSSILPIFMDKNYYSFILFSWYCFWQPHIYYKLMQEVYQLIPTTLQHLINRSIRSWGFLFFLRRPIASLVVVPYHSVYISWFYKYFIDLTL